LEQWPNLRKVGFTQFGVADYSFNYTAPIGTWVHLAFVSDGINTHLYVNGSWQDSYPATIALPLGQIGGDIPFRCINHVKGLVDEFSIYNRALDAAEIQALYQAGSGGKCLGGFRCLTSPIPTQGEGMFESVQVVTSPSSPGRYHLTATVS